MLDNINGKKCFDLIYDFTASHENVINNIPLTFMNEELYEKYFSFDPLMVYENITK